MVRLLRQAVPVAALLLVGAGSQAQIRVRVNDEPVQFSGMGPQQVQGRVLVPLRGVLEKMGAYVDWVPSTQTVVATKGSLDLQLRIGSRTALVNGKEVTLDVPAATMGGSTMVPLRFVGETLGADVRWEAPTSTVLITTSPSDLGDPGRRGERNGVRGADYERRNNPSGRRRDRDLARDRDLDRDLNRDPIRDRDPNRDRDLNRDLNRDPRRDRDLNREPDPAPARAARPVIDRITQDRRGGWLRAGDTLTVRMRGTPNSDASFRIPGVAENVKMREVSPGQYEQTWTVPGNASLNLSEAPILGVLRAPNGDERDASVVQAADVVQVDNAAPKISDVNPAPKSEVGKPRPLISATFSDQGGSGIATEKVRVLVDGRDVTNDASVTGQFFSYTPSQPLEGRSHRVDVTVYDRAGNTAQQSWDFTAPVTQAVKGIEEIKTNARGELKPGNVINFAVRGMPGGRAAWTLGGWKNIPLRESTPGLYVGSYKLRETDDLDKAHLMVTLTAPNGRKFTETYAEALSVVTGPPEAPKITYPGPNDKLTDPLVIRGTGAPNSTVRLKLDYTDKVLGVLGVKGTASQTEVVVGPDGKWASKPLELGSLLRSKNTQLTVSAVAVNAREQESPVTALRIR